ncbi:MULTISPECIES: hypothetical protein [unclassified Cupriavidus]|uniref:hypothetical protein n=1 Tax=unclassified Cupriavidus TaxID=2640874 RepID=UPI00313E20B8
MVDVSHPLSPVLAALLLKEFTREQIATWIEQPSEDDLVAMERFHAGLEEHRLELRGENDFCTVVIVYLEAILDPGGSYLEPSGIEVTASSATKIWSRMTDIQRTELWREAKALHDVIAPLEE